MTVDIDKLSLIENIMGDATLPAAQKTAIIKLIVGIDQKAGKRLNARILDALKKVVSWGSYDDEEVAEEKPEEDEKQVAPLIVKADLEHLKPDYTGGEIPVSEEIASVPLPEAGGIKVYQDTDGNLRWLSVSSNAFEDLDRELFTTKALEEAVAYADAKEERGPLLIYHVPSAVIGQCDYQAMAGRFLIESGTFDDTPLGRKAIEYFANTDEEHQVSIGYQYQPGDKGDGVYNWLRFIERSVTPKGAAANPWTDFRLIGGKDLDANKTAVLQKIFGMELANQVITSAEEKTKELEALVRFKAFGDEDKPKDDEEDEDKPKKKDEEDEEDEDKKELAPVFSAEQVTALAANLADLNAQMGALAPLAGTVLEMAKAMNALANEVKALKASDDEKVAEIITPRFTFPGGIRPTENKENELPQAAIDALKLDGSKEDQSVNPARKYIDDIVKRGVGVG